MELKYLFTAIYSDGTTYKQTKEDVSVSDPTRSAFFDVNQSNLIAFGLENDKDAIVVDLRDGSFSLNGCSFLVYDKVVENRRLIFFRRHYHQFTENLAEELSHIIQYHIGWQGNDPATGENIQRTIILS